MNTPDLVANTIINALQLHLAKLCRVTNAWPTSNTPIGDTSILSIEPLTPQEDLTTATITNVQHTPGQTTATITIDTGNARLSLHANLFVAHPNHARTQRSQILQRIQQFFQPQPGHPPTRTLQLDHIPGNRATYHIEETRNMDDPRRVSLGEFRALIRIAARYPLLHQDTANVATHIHLLQENYPTP